MNILPKDFQEEKVAEFVKRLRRASRDAREGELQAVSLASPTGSGKTVMLIDAIEKLLTGDDENPPRPDATFLWITDQPELNRQTRNKMLAFSTVLTPATLTELDNDFDAETFAPGRVYFLNTQKLGRNSRMVVGGTDERNYSIWETIANTTAARPGGFFVLIDEAHRGMAQSTRDRNEANAIIQKFILGSEEDGLKPVPLIVGISATIARFKKLLAATQTRAERAVTIDPKDVRASGLIKDAIQFTHPTETQPSDMTLLRAAVQAWKTYGDHWQTYCKAQGEPFVNPLLAIQVTDARAGAEGGITQTNLADVITGIEAEAGALSDAAYAHAFQDKADQTVGTRTVRYLAPSEIHEDPDARIVFFKSSLTTGWDCPRAEVMMSFRTAADATAIAQLVGRMVRTPFARRIEADEHLNTVALFLPHYDPAGLNRVIKELTDPESDLVPPTEVRTRPVATLNRAPDSDALFAALATLPSYTVPRATTPNEVRRLMKLGRALSRDGLYPDAPDAAKALMVGTIDAAFARLEHEPAFRAIVDERSTLDIQRVAYLYGEGLADKRESGRIAVSPENVNDLFEAAGRKIGEGLHKEWWRRRVDTGGVETRRAKLELIALATDDLKRDLAKAAKERATTWLTIHQEKMDKLPEAKRQAYEEIQGLASEPERFTLAYPDVIEATVEETTWPMHVFADDQGRFPTAFNAWETAVLKEELKRSDLAGWLRVVPRKPWALTIPYRAGGKDARWKPVYIDFLMVRRAGDGALTVDILDPHNPNLGDAAEKLAGLAEHAEAHGDAYGRIESILLSADGEIRRLNLKDPAVRERAKRVRASADVLSLFAEVAVSLPTG